MSKSQECYKCRNPILIYVNRGNGPGELRDFAASCECGVFEELGIFENYRQAERSYRRIVAELQE